MSVQQSRRILVINAGGGSLRVSLFDWEAQEESATHYADWTQEGAETTVHDHAEALRLALEKLDTSRIGVVAHRIVHGGNHFRTSVLINDQVRNDLERLVDLAPLHNKPALEGIRAMDDARPGIPQVAVFDTTFHRTLPPPEYIYPLPYEWYERWGLRRFGFHGLSHAYCAERAAAMLKGDPLGLRLVNCHLGSGCSLAAIAGGRSVATTMGFTPLEGLMMATRSGTVDPGLLLYLQQTRQMDAADLEDILNKAAGLKGITGGSGDMRDVLEARRKGDERAALAFDIYTLRIREGIGAMVTHLGGLDAVSFTDGVGEHVPEVREAVLEPLDWLGIKLDRGANRAARADVDIAAADSSVRILIIHTREELMAAREARRLVQGHPLPQDA
jgi:acetate kinase